MLTRPIHFSLCSRVCVDYQFFVVLLPFFFRVFEKKVNRFRFGCAQISNRFSDVFFLLSMILPFTKFHTVQSAAKSTG